MNKEEFLKELSKENIIIDENLFNKFTIYIDFLMEYNEHTNLTAIRDYDMILLKHFYDCLIIEKYFDFKNVKTLLDIGTGAGFPGMILAIMHPNIEVTLLDSNNKKLKFLELLTKKLSLKNVILINKRAEEYVKEKREYFDVVTSRAVSHLAILSELSIPFIKIGGYFIPLKGNIEVELQQSKDIISILGGTIEKINNYQLIKENSMRNILIIKKITKTNILYPRNYSQIKKIVLNIS